ncbi:MAG: tetratricopeptide repeat protein, partial [Chloroflexi bacterium]|nr:tetratricopeptide repeat protein [Chloroflexota bacterium]
QVYGADHISMGDALMAYAWNLRQAGDGAGAEKYAREALAVFEKQNDARRSLGAYSGLLNFLIKQSKYVEAEAVGQKALALAREKGQDVKAAEILQSLSTIKRVTRSPVEAEKLSREALALQRRLSKPPPPYSLLEHGTNLSVLRKYEEAEPLLREALASFRERNFDEGHPSVLDVKRRLGDLLAGKGDSAGLTALRKDLIVSLRKSLESQPDNATLRTELGESLFATGDVDGAMAQYAEAIAKNPTLVMAWKGRAECFAAKGDFAKATDEYSKALKLSTLPGQRETIGHSLRISGFGRRGAARLDEAEHFLRTAARIFEELRDQTPDNSSHWHFLADTHREVGLCLLGRNKPEEAEKEFRKAIEIHEQRVARKAPGDYVNDVEWSLAFLDLARLLIKSGRTQEAVPLVARGVEVNHPND